MTETSPELFKGRSSTQEFLLNKTESEEKGHRFQEIPQSVIEDLLDLFPNLLWGSAFLDHALEELEEATHFGALAIRMDPPQTSEGDKAPESPGSGPPRDLLGMIDALAGKNNGTWGLIAEDLAGLFLPEMESSPCREAAASLQRNMSGRIAGTATIGIAAYPTLSYGKQQILDNAFKAVDHAAFFGFGSLVVFDSVSLNVSGDNRYQQGDIRGAIDEYLTALELDPANVNVHNSLGVCHGVLGEYDDAMRSFQTAFELDSREVMAVYNAGLVQMLAGKRDEALRHFEKATGITPDVFETAFQMGKCYLDALEHQQARAFLEKAVDLKPDSPHAWRHLGDCYAALEMADSAVQAYRTAIKKNPTDAAALSGLGYLYGLLDKNMEIATMFCKQSIGLSPESGLFHYRLGQLYARQDRLPEAIEAFTTATHQGYDATVDIEAIRMRQDA